MIDTVSLDILPSMLTHVEHLPTLPTVAVEILRLSRDEDISFQEFTAVIAHDPALTAKILKLANSAAFRRGAAVTSLERAARMLGIKTLRLLALSFSLTDSLSQHGASGDFHYLYYWQYSLSTAVAAQALGRLIQSPYQHEAFLCGLLGRFGQLVMARIIPQRYAEVLAATLEPLPSATIESQLLGYNHHQVGAALMHVWEFPKLFIDTMRWWGTAESLPPETDEALQTLCRLTRMADMTSQIIWSTAKEHALQVLHTYGYQYFGVAAVEIDACFLSLEAKLADTAGLFDIKVTGLRDFQSILTEARDRLLQLSLGAVQELDRTTARAQDLERENHYLATLAQTDPLTGLRNRAGFEAALQQVIEARLQADNDTALGLLVMDLDHFKAINDAYGHLCGDAILKHAATQVEGATRRTDLAARYGGEEFVVLVPHTSLEVLQQIAERIRAAVGDRPSSYQGQSIHVTISIGGACVRCIQTPQDGIALLQLADQCLYEAKAAGRNRTVCRAIERLRTL